MWVSVMGQERQSRSGDLQKPLALGRKQPRHLRYVARRCIHAGFYFPGRQFDRRRMPRTRLTITGELSLHSPGPAGVGIVLIVANGARIPQGFDGSPDYDVIYVSADREGAEDPDVAWGPNAKELPQALADSRLEMQ